MNQIAAEAPDANKSTTVHTIARIIFRHQFKMNHPETTEDALQAAWEAEGKEFRGMIRRSLKKLAEKGIEFSEETVATPE